MPNVWMDEVPKVQTVGAGGIGVSPAIPVTEIDKVSADGREVVKTAKENYIPNPGSVNTGDAIVEDGGVWGSGEVGDILPDPSTANDGDVLTVDDGEWVAAPLPSEVCVVTGTTDDDTGATTLDKTYAEISAAITAGKLVYLISVTADGVVDGGLDIAYLAVSFIGVSSDVYTVVFGTEDLYKANTDDEALVDADHFVPADDEEDT